MATILAWAQVSCHSASDPLSVIKCDERLARKRTLVRPEIAAPCQCEGAGTTDPMQGNGPGATQPHRSVTRRSDHAHRFSQQPQAD